MTQDLNKQGSVEGKALWSVVVAYEDTGMREEAVAFCDDLVERFWTQCSFEISWWPFTLFQEDPASMEATQKAAEADLIILATRPEGELSAPVQMWIESWLRLRGDREGALVGLLEPGADWSRRTNPKQAYLRNVAHRAGMDYLTEVPQNMSRGFPESLDSYTERADQVTSLLDEILRTQPPPRL